MVLLLSFLTELEEDAVAAARVFPIDVHVLAADDPAAAAL
jgi:hypothetical protein